MAGNSWQAFRQLLALWRQYARMDLGWFLRDTKYCLLNIAADVVSRLSLISGAFLLSQRFGGIGGMNRTEVLFMLGYGTMVAGIFDLFFGMCNVGFLSRRAGRGQVDHMMIQPLPYWMQLLSEGFIPVSGGSTLVCGIGITIYAVGQLGLVIKPLWLVLLIASLLSSLAIIVAYSFIVGSLAFYAPVTAEEVSSSAIALFDHIRSFPLGGLSQPIMLVLCTGLPVGLVAWFPANVLLQHTPLGFPATFTIGFAVTLSGIASMLFKKGLKYYAKEGNNRYLDRGHRR